MSKRIIFSMLVIVFLAFTAVAPVYAQGTDPIEPLTPVPAAADSGKVTNETTGVWFVELAGAPTIEGAAISSVNAEHYAFRVNAAKAGIVYTERYSYTDLFNGFSIKVETRDLAKLARLPGVKSVYPVNVIPMPQTTASDLDPELFSSLNMIGAAAAQSELGFTGKGIKVAVMDTGIDVNHPAFGGNGVAELNSSFFYESPRILYGFDLVGDAYNADSTSATYNPIPVPDDIPDDCYGHGTHVAGIIGANDPTNDLKGVAPEVTFGAYRVFGCEGSTMDDVMISAMEMAQADGMQVLNMSIGDAFSWPQTPTGIAASRLVKAGMVVVASIGNSGANGLYSAGAPGLGKEVIGVASVDNMNVFLPYFTVNGTKMGYIPMTYSPPAPTSGSAEIVYVGRGCNTDTYLANPSGKIALIVRGVCSFSEKAEKAINNGAIAVVIYNSVAGIVSGTLGAPLSNPTIPVVGISKADGLLIQTNTAPIMLTWTDQQDLFPSPTGGLISSFSSYGLAPDLTLKPDISAPGGNIYSTYPLELGGYATLSGTSMASPHVAGAAALLLQAKPSIKALDVRGILQNNAEPGPWFGNPGIGYLDSVNLQGAGLVQIDKAILSRTINKVTVTPSKISAGEGEAGPVTTVLTIKNGSSTTLTYGLDYEAAISTGGVTTPGYYGSDTYVTFNKSSVTVPANGYAIVKATIYPASGPTNGQYGGYILFNQSEGDMVLRVPFAGFVGDYQAIDPLENGYDMPWLVSYYSADFPLTDPSQWSFSMQGDDIPFFWVHFNHQALKFKINIFNASTDASMGRAYRESYVRRNSTADSIFEYPFDGMVTKAGVTYKVPDGTYYAKIKVLKANGVATNAADWVTWTSPDFVIDRNMGG